jgi:hypothetical protein
MTAILHWIRKSPLLARVVPFAVFVALTALQGTFGDSSRYWFYLAKTLVGAGLLWAVWPVVTEMRWRLSWEAVGVGVAVFGLWVGLDASYPKLGGGGQSWKPFETFSNASGLAWTFVVVRLLGSVLVVPPLEEVFYRSFVYRYLRKADFESVPLPAFHLLAFLVTSAVFGLTHREWLAGILCGFAYQGLVCWKGRLGDAMTAHAITNLVLGVWVVAKGAWQFW